MRHALISAFGKRWADRNLVMFTVYVDDSGTAPDQPVAVAAALIISPRQIISLDSNWRGFREKYGFADFHSSECVARNGKSIFAGWDESKVKAAFYRARQIIKQKTSKAFSVTVYKSDFDAEASMEWRNTGGGQNHYTWALRTLLSILISWHGKRRIELPYEFVFDWIGNREKPEIEMLLAQFESVWPERIEGHYQFRKRQDVPGLQAADVLAWTCYGVSRLVFRNTPLCNIAEESFRDFSTYRNGEWLDALTFERDALREAIADQADSAAEKQRREWFEQWVVNRKRHGKPVPRIV